MVHIIESYECNDCQQISPLDIEEFLNRRFGLSRTCAVGIADHEHGSDLLAVAILNNTERLNLTEEDIQTVFKQELADYKQLRGGVYFLDQFPMTSSGKLKRLQVKHIVTELYNSKGKEL